MLKQLQNMYSIEQSDNESRTEQQIPTGLPEAVVAKLKLYKIGTEDHEHEQQKQQLNIDEYLQTQRANSKAKVNKPKHKTPQQLEKEQQFKEGYGKGFKMLQKMGFSTLKGLGKNEQGRTDIVEPQFKTALTTRDEDYEEQQQRLRKQAEKQQKQKQEEETNPYNENQFEQLFQYGSRIPSVNSLLISLRNKYEIYRSKLDMLTKENDSFTKDMHISESLKIQKQNEIKQLDKEIEGLQSIQRSSDNIQKYPHLGIAYNADLLIVKEAIDRLQAVELAGIRVPLGEEIRRVRETLSALYLAKEKQNMKMYNQLSAFQVRMQGIFKTRNQPQHNSDELISLSQQDSEKINKYLRLILEQGLLNNKLEAYLARLSNISECSHDMIDVLQLVKATHAELCQEIKIRYLIPLCNNYLIGYKPQPQSKKLPHVLVFPWLMVLQLEQLNIMGFIRNLSSRLWGIDNDDLFNVVSPWLRYFTKEQYAMFVNFYLAPRMLCEMESFSLQAVPGNQKEVIRGFIKYGELLPQALRREIIENSLALKLLDKYRKEIKEDPAQEKDLKAWLSKWMERLDKLSPGTLLRFMELNGVTCT